MKITDVKNEHARRYAKAIDKNKDGELSTAELDAAVRRPDPVILRLMARAYGDDWAEVAAGIGSGAGLERVLGGAPAGGVTLAGPSLPYDKLFEGPRSEWIVAFGGDDHRASSEKAPPDVSQYRGFKIFLERLGFKAQSATAGIDQSGRAVFAKTVTAPDGHAHELTVVVVNSTHHETAADEFMKVSAQRRGYFSLSHAGGGLGMRIGGQFIRPEAVLDSPAPAILLAPIACRTFEHFAGKVGSYLEQHKIPKEKVAYLGTTQEIEMTQADGAMAILKQAFLGALAMNNVPMILRAADHAYTPIMASYDPAVYERNREAMVMDADIDATPVLKGWLGGQTVELPKKRSVFAARIGG